MTGGSSRSDVAPLLILRPIAVIVCGYALWTLSREKVECGGFLLIFAAIVLASVAVHLIPLPPSIWKALPGREIIVAVNDVTGLGAVWRPLSMAPAATGNALYSLFVPLAVLLLTVQINSTERYALLPVLIALGTLSALLGLLQAVGAANGLDQLYNGRNSGGSFGLFANRNHAAVFLASLLPMLSVFTSQPARSRARARFRTLVALAIVVLVVPLILVSGSRAGLVAAVLGVATVPLLHRPRGFSPLSERGTVKLVGTYLAVGAAITGLVLLSLWYSRAAALERLLAGNQWEDLRFRIWGPIVGMTAKYFPFGSGFGSFVEAYKVDEPSGVLSPTYANHAHNDWLEIAMTGGALGIALLAIAVLAWARQSHAVWRARVAGHPDLMFGLLGSTLLLFWAIASLSDYPLRTPFLMCVAVVAAVWLQTARTDHPSRYGSGEIDGNPTGSPLARSRTPPKR